MLYQICKLKETSDFVTAKTLKKIRPEGEASESLASGILRHYCI